MRHDDEIASKLVFWQPTSGTVKRGRRKHTYVDTLLSDTGIGCVASLKKWMADRDSWKEFVDRVRPGGRTR